MPCRALLSLLLVVLTALAAACNDSPSSNDATATPTTVDDSSSPDDKTAAPAPVGRIDVRIDGLVIQAELARTPEERAQGLSGRASLPDDGGMLFVFQEERRATFWMQGMRFPLDFIWISRDRRVADLTENVPPPEPGVPGDELPRYQPGEPVLYALEVNAGVIREFGVQVGDVVTFEPDISAEGTP